MTFSERAVEAAAKAAAEINGDDFDKIPRHKSHWIEERGHFNGRWRDINEPFQSGYLEMAEACLTAALAVDGLALQGWRTIDSAPKDGTEVLLWFPFTPDKPHWSHPTGFVFLAKWWISDGIDEDRWVDPDDCEDLGSTPTHWQPLPAPPLTAASDEEMG